MICVIVIEFVFYNSIVNYRSSTYLLRFQLCSAQLLPSLGHVLLRFYWKNVIIFQGQLILLQRISCTSIWYAVISLNSLRIFVDILLHHFPGDIRGSIWWHWKRYSKICACWISSYRFFWLFSILIIEIQTIVLLDRFKTCLIKYLCVF